jgi:DNA-directed RNA polymerase subunit RPC12/RpoP
VSEEKRPEGVDRVICRRCGETLETSQRLVICRRCGNQVRPRSDGAKSFVVDSNVYDSRIPIPATGAAQCFVTLQKSCLSALT